MWNSPFVMTGSGIRIPLAHHLSPGSGTHSSVEKRTRVNCANRPDEAANQALGVVVTGRLQVHKRRGLVTERVRRRAEAAGFSTPHHANHNIAAAAENRRRTECIGRP